MRELSFPRILIVALFVFLFSSIAINAQTTAFTYQGRLTENSAAATGYYRMEFRLFGSTVGEDQIGPTLVFDGINPNNLIYVKDGLFTVKLDFGSAPFTTTDDRFLEIRVNRLDALSYITLTPRQPITSQPYAIRALSAVTADTAANVSGNLSGDVTGTQSATVVNNVGGQSASNVASATVAANNAAVANQPNTIVKRDGSGNFAAGTITGNLSGNATTATSADKAQQADSLSSNCAGCVTDNQISSVSGSKVTGSVANATNATTATTADNALSLGGAAANQFVQTTDSRLFDARPPTAGSDNYIQHNSVTGAAQSNASFHIAGSGRIASRFSVGGANELGDVVSVKSSPANQFALNGYSSHNGSAVYGKVLVGNNTDFAAVQGEYYGTGSNGAAVRGINGNQSNGFGVVGVGNQPLVGGFNFTGGAGVAGIGYATGIYAKSASGGASQAIYTDNFGSITRVNYFDGTTQYKIKGDGVVSTVVRDTDNKRRVMFAPEAPEVLLEDYGTGKLVNGRARIELDPVFSRNITVNEKHPLKVFIQLEGDCNGVYVASKTGSGFDVVELMSGKSNVNFSWHVVASRADEELEDSLAADGSTPTKRTSRYTGLRFPVEEEGRKIALAPADANVRKPENK